MSKTVTVKLPIEMAKDIDLALADILCWSNGFIAACPDQIDRHPMGIYGVRNMRDALQRALSEAKKEEI